MSRLEAALRRASSGVVDEIPPDRPPLDEPSLELEALTSEAPSTAIAPLLRTDPNEQANPEFESQDAALGHRFGHKYADKLVVSASTPASVRENYRKLAATLHHAQAENGIKILMVTSAVPEEGKTLTATNVALTLSESYHRRVLLIDGDLRRPALAEVFQVPNVFGLTEVLTSEPERRVSLIQISPQLSLLPAGAPIPDPMQALTSERMKHLLAEAAAGFDWVIIDTPPVAVLTDAKLLSAMVDGALLVVRAGRTKVELVQKAIAAVGRPRILGVVLNRAVAPGDGHDSYYAYQGAGDAR
jgi:capsular exopolysaccharide synthesis family protein